MVLVFIIMGLFAKESLHPEIHEIPAIVISLRHNDTNFQWTFATFQKRCFNSAFDEIRTPRRDIKYLMKSSLYFVHQRTSVVYTSSGQHGHGQDQSSYHHQHNQQGFQQDAPQASGEEETKDASFLGLLKGFFGKFKGKQGKGDSDAMMKDNRDYKWLQL